jgi:5'-methylthioinosine phosphorylase
MTLAIIGGSGLAELGLGRLLQVQQVMTPFAEQAVSVSEYEVDSQRVLFLPRHGAQHTVPPHLINYRANIWALQQCGANAVLAINAVGGITAGMTTGVLVIPEQVIDYSSGRAHTFVDSLTTLDQHIDFTYPYDAGLRALLQKAAKRLTLDYRNGGIYGCTQGPRLETAAEIARLRRDGCDIVGMTGMPEAGLARELGLRYACLAFVVNRAAGVDVCPISVGEMRAVMTASAATIRQVLFQAITAV